VPEETSLHDDLAAGFEGAETSAPDTSQSDTPAPSATPSGDPSPLEAPKHWTEGDRTLFGSAARPIQERWIAREKEYRDGFNQRGQELAGFKRERDAWNELFNPFDGDLRLQGLNRHQYVQSLIEWNHRFHENPAAAIRMAAEQLGVDLKGLLEAPAQTDPALAKLRDELTGIRSELSQRDLRAREAEFKSNQDKVASFADEKGPDGKPLRPYFDEVAADIVKLLQADRSMGLDKAYDRALRMNDDVWAKVQAGKSRANKGAEDRERQQRVDKARRAAAGTDSGTVGATKKPTLREELASAFEGYGTAH
jgi:hypothetical protein